MLPLQIHLTLPPWIGEVADESRAYLTDEERVGLAIELSKHNVERSHGGPFGAAVFNAAGLAMGTASGRLLADLALGADSPELADLRQLPSPSRLPPEPWRTLAGRRRVARQNEQAGAYL